MTCCKTKTLTDDFSKGMQNWTLRGTSCQGSWHTAENRLIYTTEPGTTRGRGFIAASHRFLGLSSVQVGFALPDTAPCDADIWFRSFDYIAICRIHLAADGEQTMQYLRLNASAFSGLTPVVKADLPQGLLCRHANNTFRVELQDHTLILWLNGQEVLRHTDEEFPANEALIVHLKFSADGSQFFDFLAAAEEILPFEEQAESADTPPTLYTMQLPAHRARPYGFTEIPGEADWSITNWNGTPVYGADKKEKYTQTWLFGFEKDPTITAKVVCAAPSATARCGILARFAVEGSYLRAGYDFGRKTWFITACAGNVYAAQEFTCATLSGPAPDAFTTLQLQARGDSAQLYVDGELAVTAQGIYNVSFGRVGLFAEGTDFYVAQFTCTLPGGGKITDGVTEQTVAPTLMQSHMEIVRLDRDTLYGQFKTNRYISYDCGLHWATAPASFEGTCPGYCYPSIHRRLSDGKFIQVLQLQDFLVQESDDLQHWTDLCHILSPKETLTPQGEHLAILHVSSITELPMPGGGTRLFLPIATRHFRYDGHAHSHSTKVYYSDDGGKSWQMSRKNVADLERFTPWHGNMSWCESKIIRCYDGRLRMLCTRTLAPCVYYVDSFDNGETWTEYGELTNMPTPTSSFAICPDPAHPGTYFMVYVNNPPYFRCTIFPRTRLTLVRTDGLTFTPVLDVDRFDNVSAPSEGSPELYQILDPCINVFEDYIFISFGRSDNVGDHNTHNAQRIRFVRIDRALAEI